MKQLFDKKNSAIYLFGSFFFLLPFGGKPVVWAIAALALDFIVFSKWKNFQGFLSLKNPLVGLQFFYALHLLGLLWTSNYEAGFFDVEQKLSLLVFPILFYANRVEIVAQKKLLFNSFIAGNAAAAFYCIANGAICKYYLHKVYLNNSGILPSYAEFSVFLHVAYYSLYLNVATFFCWYLFEQSSLRLQKFAYLFLIFLFAFTIYFLSSKAGTIAYLVTVALFFAKLVWQWKHKVVGILLLAVVGLILVFVLKNNPRFEVLGAMTKEIFHPENLNPNASSEHSNGQRIFATQTALHLIKNNFLVGVGTGDVIDELENAYTKNNLTVLAHKHLNCHDQYVESFLQLGVLGFLFVLLISIGSVLNGILRKDILLFVFGIAFSINILFESMLNTQAGVVFFAAMFCFLYLLSSKKIIN